MAAIDAEVKAGLVEPLGALGVDVEAVEVQKAGRRHVVRIVIDCDGGVDLDLVATVSRRASEILDEPPLADALPGPFVLEVTSPGVDRPLTEPRHWRRAMTRLVHVTRRDGTSVEGRLTAMPSDEEVVLATSDGGVVVRLSEVQRAAVNVEFSRPDAEEAPDDETADLEE
jgi:ribosome maturation factor RimP